MADQLPIIGGTRAIKASAPASTSLLGRGLAAIQSGKLVTTAKLDEEKLFSALCRLMNAVFSMGYLSFKENAKYVLDMIRKKFGDKAANVITIRQLQGAYIGMEIGTTSVIEVGKISSIDELYLDEEMPPSSNWQELRRYEIQKELDPDFENLEMDYCKSIENTTKIVENKINKGMSKQKVKKVLEFLKKKHSIPTQKPNSQPMSENKNNETSKPPKQHD